MASPRWLIAGTGLVLLALVAIGVAVDPQRLLMVVVLAWCGVGVAVSLALFPLGTIGWPERWLVILASALMLPGLGAIVASLIPLALSTIFWLTYLGLCGVLAGLIAWRRWPAAFLWPGLRWKPVVWFQSLAVALAIVLVGVAIWIARLPVAPPADARGYTLLWMEPESSTGGAEIGIESAELDTTAYRLVVLQSGVTIHTVPEITLEPGEQWVRHLDVESSGLVRVELFRLDDPGTLYRWVEQDLGR